MAGPRCEVEVQRASRYTTLDEGPEQIVTKRGVETVVLLHHRPSSSGARLERMTSSAARPDLKELLLTYLRLPSPSSGLRTLRRHADSIAAESGSPLAAEE